jgi:hypothetical protein
MAMMTDDQKRKWKANPNLSRKKIYVIFSFEFFSLIEDDD